MFVIIIDEFVNKIKYLVKDLIKGEVPELEIGAVSKAARNFFLCGFESHPLRLIYE